MISLDPNFLSWYQEEPENEKETVLSSTYFNQLDTHAPGTFVRYLTSVIYIKRTRSMIATE